MTRRMRPVDAQELKNFLLDRLRERAPAVVPVDELRDAAFAKLSSRPNLERVRWALSVLRMGGEVRFVRPVGWTAVAVKEPPP